MHTQEIILCLGKVPSDIVRRKRGSCLDITYLQLISSILETNSLKEASTILKVHENTLYRLLLKVFSNKDSKIPWRNYFLSLIGKRKCWRCDIVKKAEEFPENSTRIDYHCKECQAKEQTIRRNTLPEVRAEIAKRHYDTHKDEYISRNILYRTKRKTSTPTWANLDKIKEIYDLCPEGYQVDHIIPLQGKYVSGLHVETNLQYLSEYENKSKGNTWHCNSTIE